MELRYNFYCKFSCLASGNSLDKQTCNIFLWFFIHQQIYFFGTTARSKINSHELNGGILYETELGRVHGPTESGERSGRPSAPFSRRYKVVYLCKRSHC